MACQDCFTGCGEIIPDKCIQYTGVESPVLGICTGDFLSDVEEIIINKIEEILTGQGVTLDTLTFGCTYTQALVANGDKSLGNLIQKLYDSQCTLKQLIDNVSAQVGISYPFNTSCLTLPTNPTKDDILQATITKLCSVNTRVTNIENDYVKATQLPTLVNQIIQGANNSNSIQYNTRLVPYAAFPYFGAISNFDNTGKGLVSTGFDKVYICNGLNGTPDLRGRAIVGAVRNIPGNALDAAVDPVNPLNPNTNYGIGDKFGENYHALIASENGPHTHTVTDPGHTHTLPPRIQVDGVAAGGEGGTDEKALPQNLVTGSSKTGITIASSGNGVAHENRQPSIAAAWIMYIP